MAVLKVSCSSLSSRRLKEPWGEVFCRYVILDLYYAGSNTDVGKEIEVFRVPHRLIERGKSRTPSSPVRASTHRYY